MIFATDLDRTVIHSKNFIKGNDCSCIEATEEKKISYMTYKSLDLLQQLQNLDELYIVPVTTRSYEQFCRVTPFNHTHYAICANGGIILKDGKPLDVWSKKVEEITSKKDYSKVGKLLDAISDYFLLDYKIVDGIFFFAPVKSALVTKKDIFPYLKKKLPKGWTYTLQGFKLYIIPEEISKEGALEFLKTEIIPLESNKEEILITSGDGKLDKNFIDLGDVRFIPQGSEVLRYIEDTCDYNLVSEGMKGAEEILEFVLNEFKK